jgi:glycine dehydrogenase subunit 1
MMVVIADPISLGLLEAPGKYGADIVFGEGQPMGIPMEFGGPHLGFFACHEKNARRIAGRVVGATTDVRGQRGFVLTLQTREQHIRREKATSNICSNEALCALAALVYCSTMGKQGLRDVAEQCAKRAYYAAKEIDAKTKFKLAFKGPFFREFVVKSDACPCEVQEKLAEKKVLGGLDMGRWYPELKGYISFAVTEKRSKEEIDALVEGLEGVR